MRQEGKTVLVSILAAIKVLLVVAAIIVCAWVLVSRSAMWSLISQEKVLKPELMAQLSEGNESEIKVSDCVVITMNVPL